MSLPPSFELSPEVAEAMWDRRPVVALESTIVAHGMPWPENLQTGQALEKAVRDGGAVPATIAVIGGKVRIGTTPAQLEQLAREPEQFPKTGVADLAVRVVRGGNGATTVSATAVAAAHAGVRVFSTGGIGGVHRDDPSDVSSDLTTLARLPLAVVSSGAKAILDLPRTLEALETLGVLVLGVGTDEFPAFYVRSSGLPLEHRVDTAEDAARICHARWSMGERGGVLLANPIPTESALPDAVVSHAIQQTLSEASARSIHGKPLTPWLLARVADVTGRRSLDANRALAVSNARFGAAVAVALAVLPALPNGA